MTDHELNQAIIKNDLKNQIVKWKRKKDFQLVLIILLSHVIISGGLYVKLNLYKERINQLETNSIHGTK